MHPRAPSECSGGIIRAHTVQRATSLAAIASNGHVIRLNSETRSPERIGVREASTFRGFCEHHDGTLFKALDTKAFSGSREQLALLGFRATAQELHKKQSALRAHSLVRKTDAGRSVISQIEMQNYFDGAAFGAHLGLQDMQVEKQRWDAELVEPANVEALVVPLPKNYPMRCTGTCAPEFDFGGTRRQSLDEQLLANWTYSIHSASNGVFAVMAWLGPSPIVQRMVDSFCRCR